MGSTLSLAEVTAPFLTCSVPTLSLGSIVAALSERARGIAGQFAAARSGPDVRSKGLARHRVAARVGRPLAAEVLKDEHADEGDIYTPERSQFVGSDERDRDHAHEVAIETAFTCPLCGQNAWGKPDLAIVCGRDGLPMKDTSKLVERLDAAA